MAKISPCTKFEHCRFTRLYFRALNDRQTSFQKFAKNTTPITFSILRICEIVKRAYNKYAEENKRKDE